MSVLQDFLRNREFLRDEFKREVGYSHDCNDTGLIDYIEWLEKKITSPNKQSTPCCVCGVGVAELCGECHTEIVSSVVN